MLTHQIVTKHPLWANLERGYVGTKPLEGTLLLGRQREMGRLLHVGKRTRAGNGQVDLEQWARVEYAVMNTGKWGRASSAVVKDAPWLMAGRRVRWGGRTSPWGRALHSHDEEWTVGTQAQWEELGDLSFSLGSATTKSGNLFSPQSPHLGHMMTFVGPRTFVFCGPFPP